MSQLTKNTTYITAATISQKVVAFVYFALIARIVGAEYLGNYNVAITIMLAVNVIADLGLTPVLIREVAKNPEGQQKQLSATITLKLALYAMAALLMTIIATKAGYPQQISILLMIALAVLILDSTHLTYYGVLRGNHRLKFESIGLVIGQLITLTVGVTSLLINPSLTVLMIALVAGSTWSAIYSATLVKRIGLKPLQFRIQKTYAKKLIKAAIPFALAAIFVKVYASADMLIIDRLLGAKNAGYYTIANKLTFAFQFIPMSFIAVLYPTFSKQIHIKDRKSLKRTFQQSMSYLAILGIPIAIGISTTADKLVPLIYSQEFAPAIQPLQILVYVLVLIFLDFPIGALLNADDRQSTKTAIMGITMLVNIAANIILIPKFGIIGAPYAALMGYTTLFILGMIAAHKSLPYKPAEILKPWSKIAASGLIMGIITITIKDHTNIIITIMAAATIYTSALLTLKAVSIDQLTKIWKAIRT